MEAINKPKADWHTVAEAVGTRTVFQVKKHFAFMKT